MEPTIEVIAEVLDVRDGDTVNVMAHPWPGFSPTTAIRISGNVRYGKYAGRYLS